MKFRTFSRVFAVLVLILSGVLVPACSRRDDFPEETLNKRDPVADERRERVDVLDRQGSGDS